MTPSEGFNAMHRALLQVTLIEHGLVQNAFEAAATSQNNSDYGR